MEREEAIKAMLGEAPAKRKRGRPRKEEVKQSVVVNETPVVSTPSISTQLREIIQQDSLALLDELRKTPRSSRAFTDLKEHIEVFNQLASTVSCVLNNEPVVKATPVKEAKIGVRVRG